MIGDTRLFFVLIQYIFDKWKLREQTINNRKTELMNIMERELDNMRIFSSQHLQDKKYNSLNKKLHKITKYQKDAILGEYFSVCKNLMRI